MCNPIASSSGVRCFAFISCFGLESSSGSLLVGMVSGRNMNFQVDVRLGFIGQVTEPLDWNDSATRISCVSDVS